MQENNLNMENLFEIQSSLTSKEITESEKVLICIFVLIKTVDASLGMSNKCEILSSLCVMYQALLSLKINSNPALLKLLLTSDTFVPKNVNQLMFLITSLFLSLHKIRFSFIEGQKRMTCYRFLFFGRKPTVSNSLRCDENYIFSKNTEQQQKELEASMSNSTKMVSNKFYYHTDYQKGTSLDAKAKYSLVSESSATDKEKSEKLSWDNLYSRLLTNHCEEIQTKFTSPDSSEKRQMLRYQMANDQNKMQMYFLKDYDKLKKNQNGFTVNDVFRFYLYETSFFLNKTIFNVVPENLRELPSTLTRSARESANSSDEKFAQHFLNGYAVWNVTDFKSFPYPRIQAVFNRLVQECCFANSTSIPQFLNSMKCFFQLNTIPDQTRRLLDECMKKDFLRFHKCHVDETDKNGDLSFENVPMVSFCQIWHQCWEIFF